MFGRQKMVSHDVCRPDRGARTVLERRKRTHELLRSKHTPLTKLPEATSFFAPRPIRSPQPHLGVMRSWQDDRFSSYCLALVSRYETLTRGYGPHGAMDSWPLQPSFHSPLLQGAAVSSAFVSQQAKARRVKNIIPGSPQSLPCSGRLCFCPA